MRARNRRAFVLALLTLLAAPRAGLAADFVIVPEKSIAYDMSIAAIDPPYRSGPYRDADAPAWTRTIVHRDKVTAVTVHLLFKFVPPGSSWTLIVSDLDRNEIQRFDPTSDAVKRGEAWTEEVRGRGAVLELRAAANPGSLQITADKYAYRVPVSHTQSVTGQRDDSVSIRGVSSDIQNLGRSVARLRFMTATGRGSCTAFLVGKDLLLTNQHCIATESEMFSAVAEFGYDDDGMVPSRFQATALEATSEALDYSLLRLNGDASREFGMLALQADPRAADHAALAVIQHPGGRPKRVSIVQCEVAGPIRGGRSDPASDFGHVCDTHEGSSGSPVIDLASGQVVGLHHFGFAEGAPDPVNQAVHSRRVVDDLPARLKAEIRIVGQ